MNGRRSFQLTHSAMPERGASSVILTAIISWLARLSTVFPAPLVMVAFAFAVGLTTTPARAAAAPANPYVYFEDDPSVRAAAITVRGTDVGTADSPSISECSQHQQDFRMSATAFLSLTANATKRFGFCRDFYVSFAGDIDANSMASLRNVIERIENRFNPSLVALSLDSDGGDVWQAMAFARFIRAHNYSYLIVQVVGKSRCYSSCVFILAGGIQRFIEEGAMVGIHRPYFTDQAIFDAGYKSLQQAYDGLLPQIKTFLDSVNISERLASDMWFVPSDQIRVLTDEELEQYGLSRSDAIFKELQNSNLRAACGNEAPENYNDWLVNAYDPCRVGSGRFDGVCLHEKTRKHPYCRCFAAANPGYTCD